MNALSLISNTPLPKNDREDTTLAGLVERLELRDAETLPDRTVQLSKVRMTVDGTLILPSVQGSYGLTEWARGQLSRAVGVTWDRYFSNARPTDVAEGNEPPVQPRDRDGEAAERVSRLGEHRGDRDDHGPRLRRLLARPRRRDRQRPP